MEDWIVRYGNGPLVVTFDRYAGLWFYFSADSASIGFSFRDLEARC